MAVEPLSQKEIEDRLAELPGWSVDDAGRLTRSYRLGSHVAAAALVMHIAAVQDELDHHSDLTLGYNTVSVSVTTHSAGGALTANDFALARRVEDLAPGHQAH
ncbi:4a-hydroxytetrahydrobiopterin dehydratase [Streptomyces sp. NPDC004059]